MAETELKTRSSPPSSPAPGSSSSSPPSSIAQLATTFPFLAFLNGPSFRQHLAEARRISRTVATRLQPYLPRIILFLLSLCCLTVLLPTPPLKANATVPASTVRNVATDRAFAPGLAPQAEIPLTKDDGEMKPLPVLETMGTGGAAEEEETPSMEQVAGQKTGSTEALHTRAAGPAGLNIDGAAALGREEADFAVVTGLDAACKEKAKPGHLRWDPLAAASADSSASGDAGGASGEASSHRFLLLDCFRGQIGKHMQCLANHILLSGLLNRTLIVPRFLPDWRHATRTFDMNVVFDLDHTRTCFGSDTVIRTTEFVDRFKVKEITLDMLYCWHGPKGACGDASRKKQNGRASPWDVTWTCPASVNMEKSREMLHSGAGSLILPLQVHPPFFQDPLTPVSPDTPAKAACLPLHAPLSHVMSVYGGVDSKVLALGDLGEHDILEAPEIKAAGEQPFVRDPGCSNGLAVSPHPALLAWGEELVGKLFPKAEPFLAAHWMGRPTHMASCQRSNIKGKCFYGMGQAASCVADEAKKHNLWKVYLARGHNKGKMEEFKQEIWRFSDGKVTITQLPEDVLEQGSSWLEALREKGVDTEAQRVLILNTLDKIISAHASVFVGNPESPNSWDIQRLRQGLGRGSCSDGNLCRGEIEWDPLRIH